MDHVEMLSWADRHLDRVERSAERFMRKDPYISSCDADFKRRSADSMEYAFNVRLRLPVVEPPKRIVFKIGDALHALRVSLDYLAVHVVTKALPGTDEGQIAFPIIGDSGNWGSAFGKIGGVTGGLLDAFKSVQPCFGAYSSRPDDDPLLILDRLEKPHKHRRLLDVLPGPYSFKGAMVSGDPADVICLHVTLPQRPLGEYEKVEIARYRIAMATRTEPKAKVEGKVRFFVCFDSEGPARGEPAITLLKKMRDHIRDNVFPAFNDFL